MNIGGKDCLAYSDDIAPSQATTAIILDGKPGRSAELCSDLSLKRDIE
jgi:hypothetical protein